MAKTSHTVQNVAAAAPADNRKLSNSSTKTVPGPNG